MFAGAVDVERGLRLIRDGGVLVTSMTFFLTGADIGRGEAAAVAVSIGVGDFLSSLLRVFWNQSNIN